MTTLQRRLALVLAAHMVDGKPERGLQADIARLCGVSRPTVSAWFNNEGKVSTMERVYAEKICARYRPDISPAWLAEDLSPKKIPEAKDRGVMFSIAEFTPPQANTEEVKLMGAVPLISSVQAGAWSEVFDPFAPGVAEEWLPCPVRHGPRTYAVKVRGESMRNPDGRPSYNDGDILFVDPDRSANHGDRVIVRLDDQAEATFKQLLIEDGRKMLKALNPDWKPRYVEINGNATISGVVIGKWVPE